MRRKTAIIITIYDPNHNLGNRLQNYATQSVLKKFNFSVNTLSFERSVLSGKQKIKAIAQRVSNYHLPGDKNYWCLFPKRVRNFKHFNKKYIKTYSIQKISQIKAANFYILGSDQVWNTAWYREGDMKKDLFLLTFARPEQKICFAPSFSMDFLPEEWHEWFRENLRTFPSLNVREEAGQRIIKNLTGQDAEVLIDPTLMLNRSDWMKIAKRLKKIDTDRPYILTYFLGRRSDRVNQTMHNLAKKYNCEVYNLMDMTQPEVYISGPSEFIYLISRAKLVLTDSFHACVFSFLFGKPFLVYAREGECNNMMSRMDTLLKKFGLERKYVDSGLPNDILECNYQHGYEMLALERQKVIDYLKKAMHIE